MTRLVWLMMFCLVSSISFAEADNNNSAANSTKAPALKSGVFEPPRAAPDFSLAASNGKQFTLSQQPGKLFVLGFGFSHCPNVCPMTLANLAQAWKKLGDLAAQAQVIYITVDPERDSPERLREYLAHFNSQFIGLTGSVEELSVIRQAYGIIAKKEVHGDGDYEVHHSSYLYLIDQQGLLRALVPFGKSADDIVHDIKILLQSAPPQAS